MTKITEQVRDRICERLLLGEPGSAIAKDVGCSATSVSEIGRSLVGPEWFTAPEAANLVGVSETRLASLCCSDLPPPFRPIGGRRYFVHEEIVLWDMKRKTHKLVFSTASVNVFEFVRIQGDDDGFIPEPAEWPTKMEPGSWHKIEVMCRRLQEGQELFHKGDATSGG